MDRPKINLKLSLFDQIVEILSVVALLTLMIIPIIYFGQLPDRIPSHFDFSGNPDSYLGKGSIWILPIVGLVLYIGLTILNRFPHKFNYPAKITPENAEKLYGVTTQMMRVLKVVILGLFNYMTYQVINVALNHAEGLGGYFVWVYLVFILGVIGVYIYKMNSLKKKAA